MFSPSSIISHVSEIGKIFRMLTVVTLFVAMSAMENVIK